MAYTKTTWVNDSEPAINATNLNKIEQGIYDAHDELTGKVDAVTGKGLSTNDYTTAEQTKLSGIEAGAEVNVIETVKVDGSALTPDANKAVDIDLSGKQDALVSGTNIKTVNGSSLLGSGNIVIQGGGSGDTVTYTATVASGTELGKINISGTDHSVYAPTIPSNVSSFNNDSGFLTSHQSIKTINSTSMVGSGNVAVQPTLVSGTNIKTVQGNSLLGSGNVSVHSAVAVTISVANWNATTTCTKSVTGVTASNNVVVSPDPTSMDDYIDAGIVCTAQASGTLTFTCNSTPSSSIVVNVLIYN